MKCSSNDGPLVATMNFFFLLFSNFIVIISIHKDESNEIM